MKKFFLMLFTVAALGLGTSSCGSDDDEPVKPDLTMRDLSLVAGNYSGSCVMNVTSKIKEPITEAQSFVRLIPTNNSLELMLETTQFGVVTEGDKVQNFAYTSESKKECVFTSGGQTRKDLIGGSIPAYVQSWFGKDYNSITKVDIEIQNTTALYNLTTKGLKFQYKGTITVYAVVAVGGVTDNVKDVYNVTYDYNVVKK